MLKLYGDVQKTRSNRCSWMLNELGIERVDIPLSFHPGETKPADFLALNPNGKCPTLVDDEFVIYESLAINLYLAKKHGGSLAPQDIEEDALMTQWSLWVATEIEKPLLLAASILHLFHPRESSDEELAIAFKKLARPFDALETHLTARQFVVADRFTAADLNIASVMHLIPIADIDISRWPAIKRWLDCCLSRPAALDVKSVGFKVPRPSLPRDMLAMFL